MKLKINKKILVGRILSFLVSAPFFMSAAMKVTHGPQVIEGMAHFGWPESALIKLAILELFSVVLYLIPATSVLGAILLTGYLGGAIATHTRVDESALVPVIFGIIVWLGLFLREERLWELLPVRGKDFAYTREIVIHRSLPEVFRYLKLLDNFRNWNPFIRKDPNVTLSGRGVDGQAGYIASWKGIGEVGSGEQEITRIEENDRIEFELRFSAPFKATNQAYFAVEVVNPEQTRVRWSMSGKNPFPINVISLIINCDKMVGGEFEHGLAQLKIILER